jgi:membrane protease YdiL (CAAX protease family)
MTRGRARRDYPRLAAQVGLFVVAYCALLWVLGSLLSGLAQNLVGPFFAGLFSALIATWLALRIYEDFSIVDVGLWWNRSSADNLALGLAGGAGAACLALGPPLAVGAAHLVRSQPPAIGGLLFALACVAAGSAGEELFFRGYAFQLLFANLGPWAAILPVGVAFGLMHAANPGASPLGLVNTAGFGVLFGYAYMRSRDLWLPMGLHFGWNMALPLLGANLSGITIFKEIAGYEMAWRAGSLWSGGDYGPEASLLTSVALVPLFVFLWKAPIRRQRSPLTDPPAESATCEPSPPLPS